MYLMTPEVIAKMIGEKDIARVSTIMKVVLSSLAYVSTEGEVSCEGIKITKINPTTLILHVDVIPEYLADVLEGQDLIRIPV